MKKYKVYLSDIEWSKINTLDIKKDKGWTKSDIVFMETMPYKELSNVRNETTWYLVSNDYVEENEKLHSIIKEVREYIKKKSLCFAPLENYQVGKDILEIIDVINRGNK